VKNHRFSKYIAGIMNNSPTCAVVHKKKSALKVQNLSRKPQKQTVLKGQKDNRIDVLSFAAMLGLVLDQSDGQKHNKLVGSHSQHGTPKREMTSVQNKERVCRCDSVP
jgi:hypothetical protein